MYSKLISLIVLLFIAVSQATHFRAGVVTWSTDHSSNTLVNFEVVLAFRTDYPSYTIDPPVVGDTIGDAAGVQFCFGDGSACITEEMTVTSVNAQDDWFTATWSFSHQYPAAVGSYVAYYTGCCRLSTILNDADEGWYVSTLLNLNPSVAQSSPTSSVLPILPVEANLAGVSVQISAASPALHSLGYSIATGAQMGGASETQPPGAAISSKGVLSFSALAPGYYATQVIVTDLVTGNYIGIDFLVYSFVPSAYCTGCNPTILCASTSQCTPTCGATSLCIQPVPIVITDSDEAKHVVDPATNLPSPKNGKKMNFYAGQDVTIFFVADDLLFPDAVYMYSASIPVGASFSAQESCTTSAYGCNCVGCNNPQVMKFEWTPTLSDLGTTSVCIGVRSYGNELPYSEHCVILNIIHARPFVDLYTNYLSSVYGDLSNATHTLNAQVYHTPYYSMSYTPTPGSYLLFSCNNLCINMTRPGLQFFINGGTTGKQDISVEVLNSNHSPATIAFNVDVATLLGTKIPAGKWVKVSINFSDYTTATSPLLFNQLKIYSTSKVAQGEFYIDDVQFIDQ